jgi:hypothetical protein
MMSLELFARRLPLRALGQRSGRFSGLLAVCLLGQTLLGHPGAQAQMLAQALEPGVIETNDPAALRPLNQDSSILSLQGGQRLLEEANSAIGAGNYPSAITKLQQARQAFNQLANFYQDLAGSFTGIDNRVASTQRQKALEAAQQRDETTYKLALAHLQQNQADLAIPLLAQVLKSQQPGRDLGKKASAQLVDLGFIQTPETQAAAVVNNSLFSIPGAQRLGQEAEAAIGAGNYPLAISKLKDARKILNQLSNTYQDLANSYSGQDNAIATDLRNKALETAQLRDTTTYQLALAHRQQDQPELAVPLLVQIIKSQQVSRKLGKDAYAQLFELGFVNTQYPRRR